MNLPEGISEKEKQRRIKISIAKKKSIEKKIRAWNRKQHLEALKRKRKREKEKEKERKKREEKRLREKEKKLLKLEKIKEANGGRIPKKRKPGRPRKPGPKKSYYKKKKKAVVKERKEPKFISYKVVACRNGKEIKFMGQFIESADAYELVKSLLAESEKVIFPIEKENNEVLEDTNFEYLILESNRTEQPNPFMPNEYGKLVEQKTTSNKWIILDKFPYKEEELFWVWGYNPRTDRKDFQWIYDNIIVNNLSAYDIKRVILYKNKIIIKDDNNDIEMILCKTLSDAVRFYNLLETFTKRDNLKQIVFLGSYNKISDKRRRLEEELMELTGWNKTKIQMSGTKKHAKKE